MSLKEYKTRNSIYRHCRPHLRPVPADLAGAAALEERRANVLFIVLDDVGYAQLGCYGSPIHTPNMDALAANGVRFSNMHTTALCSPTRSCILTGRNHHSYAMACITEGSTGFPGYNANIPFENGFLSEILLANGYNTCMMPILHSPGVMTPGQFGPTSRDLESRSAAFTLTMSFTGMPSVMQTMVAMPASAASMIASAANDAGT